MDRVTENSAATECTRRPAKARIASRQVQRADPAAATVATHVNREPYKPRYIAGPHHHISTGNSDGRLNATTRIG